MRDDCVLLFICVLWLISLVIIDLSWPLYRLRFSEHQLICFKPTESHQSRSVLAISFHLIWLRFGSFLIGPKKRHTHQSRTVDNWPTNENKKTRKRWRTQALTNGSSEKNVQNKTVHWTLNRICTKSVNLSSARFHYRYHTKFNLRCTNVFYTNGRFFFFIHYNCFIRLIPRRPLRRRARQ